MFEVRGQFYGMDVTAGWDNGEITGDVRVAHAMRRRAEYLEGERVGPVCGPYTRTRHLENALSAYFIFVMVFDRIDEVTGDVPSVPVTPGVVH